MRSTPPLRPSRPAVSKPILGPGLGPVPKPAAPGRLGGGLRLPPPRPSAVAVGARTASGDAAKATGKIAATPELEGGEPEPNYKRGGRVGPGRMGRPRG